MATKMFGIKFLAIVGSWLSMVSSVRAVDTIIPSSSLGQPFKHPYCPAIDDPLHPVQFGYPTDCTMYYSCQSGFAYAMTCPNNLHWSSITYRCDYPDVANCVLAPIPSIPDVTTIPSPANEPVIYQSFPGDCNRFYKCEALKCPNNLHWNSQRQQCDWPQLAQCEHSQPSTTLPPLAPPTSSYPLPPTASTPPTTSVATVLPPFVPTVPSNGLDELCLHSSETYIRYPGDCHKFIQCNGVAFVHECPSQLQWNSNLKACDRHCI